MTDLDLQGERVMDALRVFSRTNVVAATWNPDTDAVTLNWPEIEKAADDPNNSFRGFAKILLAARAGDPSVTRYRTE